MFGQVGGKIQESHEIVNEGKNIGKKNETTVLQQALLQAEADWKDKLKKGYVESIEDAQQGKLNAIIEGGIQPMLAHKFSEQGHKIKYPALCQPKLDGCVSNNTLIQTNIGNITIGEIVNKNIDCLIKTYNQITNKTEYKKILSRTKNSSNITTKWFEIEIDDGRILQVTGNHLIYLPKLKCWRRIDELEINDKILNNF
jgi:hypothetical protein